MSDIEIVYPGLDCSFLLQIILGLSIKLGQWVIENGNIAKKKKYVTSIQLFASPGQSLNKEWT